MSQSNILYHVVMPQNVKGDGYFEFDTVDFNLSAQGRKFVGGSFRLLGDVELVNNVPSSNFLLMKCTYDPIIGAHSWVEQITTSFDNMGNIESITDYPRYKSAQRQAVLNKDDLHNSTYVVENAVPHENLSNLLLKGMVDIDKATGAYASAYTKPLDFAVKLDCAINNAVGDIFIPYAKTGDIKLQLKIASNKYILFGHPEIGSNLTFKLSNLRVMYQSIPDDNKYSPQYQFRVKYSLKQQISSSLSNVTTKIPLTCDAMFATFLLAGEENNPTVNGMQNEEPPNIQEVQFIWNDSFSQEVNYSITSREELLYNYVKAVAKTVDTNNCNPNTLASNSGFGIGLNFNGLVDMSRSKFGLNINSSISSGAPYVCYLFFTGVMNI